MSFPSTPTISHTPSRTAQTPSQTLSPEDSKNSATPSELTQFQDAQSGHLSYFGLSVSDENLFGADHCMPPLILNMGGEMLYILEQRLQAQNIAGEKSARGKSLLLLRL
jgi:hypothetical protein